MSSLLASRRAQYGLIKEYTLNHIKDPYVICHIGLFGFSSPSSAGPHPKGVSGGEFEDRGAYRRAIEGLYGVA